MSETQRRVKRLTNQKKCLEEKVSLLDPENGNVREKKVLLRQLCDVTIRLRNLKRNMLRLRLSSYLSEVEKFSVRSPEPGPELGLELIPRRLSHLEEGEGDLSSDESFHTACDTSNDEEDLNEELEGQEVQETRESTVSDSRLKFEEESGPDPLIPSNDTRQMIADWMRENKSTIIRRVEELSVMDPSRGNNNNKIPAEEETTGVVRYTVIQQKKHVSEIPEPGTSILVAPPPGEKDELDPK